MVKVKTFTGSAWKDDTEKELNEFLQDKKLIELKVNYFSRKGVPPSGLISNEFVSYTAVYSENSASK